MTADPSNQYESDRRQKLQKLRDLGAEPYGVRTAGITKLDAIRGTYKTEMGHDGGPAVKAAGRLILKRDMGKLSFLTIRDESGDLQVGIDKRKVDEYLTAVRELEQRVGRSEKNSQVDVLLGGIKKPSGIPQDFQEHIRLMLDLMVLAFQGDVTRISTFMYANEGSNKSYSFMGVPEGHHDLSHHGNDKEKHEKIKKINRFHMEQFAYLLGKLKATPEGSGSLLDNSMIVYGSGIGDGNRHNHNDLPILLAGKGGGTIKSGRHIKYPTNTPLNNLYLSLLDRIGAPIESLGDSKGRLGKLDG